MYVPTVKRIRFGSYATNRYAKSVELIKYDAIHVNLTRIIWNVLTVHPSIERNHCQWQLESSILNDFSKTTIDILKQIENPCCITNIYI